LESDDKVLTDRPKTASVRQKNDGMQVI